MRLSLTYYARGTCEQCGKAFTRQKTFSGDDLRETKARGDAWETPKMCARCERTTTTAAAREAAMRT